MVNSSASHDAKFGMASGPLAAELIKGNYVTFGHYPQNNGDMREPIEWLVLKNDGKTALLVSKFGLDCKQYGRDADWRDCSLREWLNNVFLYCAFNSDELRRIKNSHIFTSGGSYYCRGNEKNGYTSDKVFCLSTEEVVKYLNDGWSCKPTKYAVERGAYIDDDVDYSAMPDDICDLDPSYCCKYWLRCPGAIVDEVDRIHNEGIKDLDDRYREDIAVRPALRIKLK